MSDAQRYIMCHAGKVFFVATLILALGAILATALAMFPNAALADDKPTESLAWGQASAQSGNEASPQTAIVINDADVALKANNMDFTGSSIVVGVMVKVNGAELVQGRDFELTFQNNIGPGVATLTVQGVGNYMGTVIKPFNIKANLSNTPVTVELDKREYVYTGSEIKPTIVVKCDGKVIDSSNYTVSYINNVSIGVGTVHVVANPDSKMCSSQTTRTFNIVAKSTISTSGGNDSTNSSSGNSSSVTPGAQYPAQAPSVDGVWKKNSKGWWFSYSKATQSAQQNKTYPASEWVKIKGKYYHFNSSGYMSANWYKQNVSWYWLGSDGAMKTKWQKVKGKWYYMSPNDGVMLTGSQLINNKWYVLDNNSGAMKTGWNRENSGWRYYDSSGAMQENRWLKTGGKWYYLDRGGLMLTGQQKIGNKTYYLDPSTGAMVTGWKRITAVWHYFDSSGAMRTGWTKVGGKWYYLNSPDGDMKIGWFSEKGNDYCLDQNGAMVTGWANIENKFYYFNKSGVMQKGCWIGNYYVDGNGVMATNRWIGRYHVNANGKWDATR